MNLRQINGANRTRHPKSAEHTLTEPEERLRLLELCVGVLIARTKVGEFWTEGFSDVALLLEAIPLTTTDFDAAGGHLRNALAYCHLLEYGAATFELRVVRGILQRL